MYTDPKPHQCRLWCTSIAHFVMSVQSRSLCWSCSPAVRESGFSDTQPLGKVRDQQDCSPLSAAALLDFMGFWNDWKVKEKQMIEECVDVIHTTMPRLFIITRIIKMLLFVCFTCNDRSCFCYLAWTSSAGSISHCQTLARFTCRNAAHTTYPSCRNLLTSLQNAMSSRNICRRAVRACGEDKCVKSTYEIHIELMISDALLSPGLYYKK